MCKFFSLVTEPEQHGGQRFYFDWDYRKANLKEDNEDSHSHICEVNGLDEDKCNKYEYNPFTREFVIDATNSATDDRVQVEEWLHNLDFKKIVEPLIIKQIINPFNLPKVEVTEQHIRWLKDWASVRDSVWASVLWASVWTSVWDSVGASVRASVWAYASTFFAIQYKYDFSPCVKLWEAGLLASFDGTTWRMHSGEKAEVVYEWTPGKKG